MTVDLTPWRDPKRVRQLADQITRLTTKPWHLMEVCGGQTHAIVRHGLDQLLPDRVHLIHGPGCPVCVTPIDIIEQAQQLARRPNTVLVSFGDMLRVPGARESLLDIRATGGAIRTVYSPIDVLALADADPDCDFVFFGVGFETTAPLTALLVQEAARRDLRNLWLLSAHVLVPPALRFLVASGLSRLDAFLLAGHVCAVTGWQDYAALAQELSMPMVVTGFEPVDILQGVEVAIAMLERGDIGIYNAYGRAVTETGNANAWRVVETIFEPCDRSWRGIGPIPDSGLGLRLAYERFDARQLLTACDVSVVEDSVCRSGEVLQGVIKPVECPAFGTACRPDRPLGAPMVSSEGACAAYYQYQKRTPSTPA